MPDSYQTNVVGASVREILLSEDLIAGFSQVCKLIVIYADEDDSAFTKQIRCKLESWIHHVQPVRVKAAGRRGVGTNPLATFHLFAQFQIVLDVVMVVVRVDEVLPGVVGGIEVYDSYLSRAALL